MSDIDPPNRPAESAGDPLAAKVPSSSTWTVSACVSTAGSSWEATTTAVPSAARSPTTSNSRSTIAGSRPLPGSSRIRTAGSPRTASPSPSSRVIPPESDPTERSATSPRPTRSRVAATCRQKRIGSLSPESRESQPTGLLRSRHQSATRTDFPNPAGAHTSVRAPGGASSRRSTSRGRATNAGGERGTCSLVASRSRSPGTATSSMKSVWSAMGRSGIRTRQGPKVAVPAHRPARLAPREPPDDSTPGYHFRVTTTDLPPAHRGVMNTRHEESP